MHHRHARRFVLTAALAASLGLATACASSESPTTPAGDSTPTATAAPQTAAAGTPTVQVAPADGLDASAAISLKVTGSGFVMPEGANGVYIGLVAQSAWQPGQTPAMQSFTAPAFVPAQAIQGGAFTQTLSVPAGTATDASATYGVATFCAHKCSATDRTLDTFTPVTFAASS